VGQHLSFTHDRKATEGYAKVRTGLGKSDRPGSQGGLVETWMMVKAKRARKAETLKQTSFYLRLRAPHFYPDPKSSILTKDIDRQLILQRDFL
jgi:hypothetical protein